MKISTTLLAFLIFSETLLPRMDGREFAKIPALIEHYHHHKNQNPGLGFLSFLDLHYNDPQHHENDHSTHDKLPFSNHQAGNTVSNPIFFVAFESSSCVREIVHISGSSTPYFEPAELSVYITIWQPPRLS
jgi:hypothetical protein